MPEWITANWLWILLAVGAAWFLLRRGGMGCGMGGGRGHGGAHPLENGAEPRVDGPGSGGEGDREAHATPARGSHRHGGCC